MIVADAEAAAPPGMPIAAAVLDVVEARKSSQRIASSPRIGESPGAKPDGPQSSTRRRSVVLGRPAFLVKRGRGLVRGASRPGRATRSGLAVERPAQAARKSRQPRRFCSGWRSR